MTKARDTNVVKLLRAAALVFSATVGLGCPGTLDPSLTGTTTSGTGGAGATTGATGGTSGGGCADGGAQIVAASCATIGCHDSNSMEGGLDLTPNSTIASRLVGVTSTGNGPDSVCGGKTYLAASSNPASGLLIDKIKGTQTCGAGMPYPGASLLPSVQQTCIEQWAEGLINLGTGGGGQVGGTGGVTGAGGATTGSGGSGSSTTGSGGSATGGTTGTGGGGSGGSPAGSGGSGAGGRIGTGGTTGAAGRGGNSGTAGATGATTGTFTQVAALLMTNCAPCHDGTAHTDLRTTGLYTRLVGGHSIASAVAACVSQTLVVAGKASMSLISNKVHGANLNGCGTQMPKGCNPGTTCLTTAQMSTIDSWINAGAMNN